MKSRILKLLLTIVLINLIVVGCSTKTGNEVIEEDTNITIEKRGIVRALEFDDEQNEILRGIGANPSSIFYYEYSNIPEEYDWLKVWVEYYEKGKKISSNLFGVDRRTSETGKIVCMINRVDDNLRITIEGSSSLQTTKKTKGSIVTNQKNRHLVSVDDDAEFLLAVRVQNSGYSPAEIGDEVFINKDYTELLEYDHVYLVKGKFHTK